MHRHSGILFSLRIKLHCFQENGWNIMLNKLRQSQKDKQRAFPLLHESRSESVWESKEIRDKGKGWCKEHTMSIFK